MGSIKCREQNSGEAGELGDTHGARTGDASTDRDIFYAKIAYDQRMQSFFFSVIQVVANHVHAVL